MLAVQTLTPLPEFELAGQGVQALDADMPVYVPAEQGVHALTPAAEYEPALHCWHVAEVIMPVPVL